MENIINYAEKELNTFKTKNFNAVDSLILSQLSYISLDNLVPYITDSSPSIQMKDLLKAEFLSSMLDNAFNIESNRKLLFALAASPRFRNIKMNYYVNKIDPSLEKQFSAVTYLLDDDTAYIAYRGTDITFVGWKEDFNMAFITPIPSQEEGVEYLNTVSKFIPVYYSIRTGGHSKGGNIAVYSAMGCDKGVQRRIIGIYDHDGPGFIEPIYESPEYLQIKDRIQKTMPVSSIIGMILRQHENYSVVMSKRFGIMQHNPFSWAVEGDDFSYSKGIKSGSLRFQRTINDWLNTLSNEKRKQFIDALYQIIVRAEVSTVNEFSGDWKKSAFAILGALKNIDPETRKFITKTINEFVKLSFKNLYTQNTNTP